MWHAMIMPSYMSKYLIKDPLQKNLNTYSILYGQTNPMYTNQYKLSTINTHCTVCCPTTGWNNVLYYYYIFIRTRCQSFQRYISNT